MAKEPIVSSLFRFATTRNPQLLSEEERERGFIYYPTPQLSESAFLPDLPEGRDERRIELQTRAATYASLKTKEIVRNVKPDLYDFALWLTRNKNRLTNEVATEKSQGVPLLTELQGKRIWDNLIYQLITKKSKAVRDALVIMIVADNFLQKNDINATSGGKKLVNNELELIRLAKAFVVVPDSIPKNSPIPTTKPPVISRRDQNLIEEVLTYHENKVIVNGYDLVIKELEKVINSINSENRSNYNAVKEIFDAEVVKAYKDATKSVDPETKEITYTNLVLPDFNFTSKTVFDGLTLQENLSPTSLSIVNNLIDEGYSSERNLLKKLRENKASFRTSKRSNKSVSILYNGTKVSINESDVIPFTYAISGKTMFGDKSLLLSSMLIQTEHENPSLRFALLDLTFNTTDVIENLQGDFTFDTNNRLIINSQLEGLIIPEGAKSYKITGTIGLDNGDVITLNTRSVIIDGKRATGIASSSFAASVPKEIEHYGIEHIGVADFRRVEQELCCYVPGEVSRIENILAKEYKERATRSLISTETTRETTEESEIESLTDTTTSERNEISSEISQILNSDESENYGASAGVNGSFNVGTGSIGFNANAFYNGSNSSSSSNANNTAQTYAKEITERALERVVQKTTKRRTSRVLREFEENNKHGFDNREGTEHVTGVYRWVDKIYKNRLVNYGKRLMYEFNVPEPSRFFKQAIIESYTTEGEEGGSLPEGLEILTAPDSFPTNDVKDAGNITVDNYQGLAAVYNAQVNALPQDEIVIAKTFSGGTHEGSAGSRQFSFNELEVPEGYIATNVKWHANYVPGINGNSSAVLKVAHHHCAMENSPHPTNGDIDLDNYIDTSIPVSVAGWDLGSFIINLELVCVLTEQTKENWQNETFNTIFNAYKDRVDEYNDELYANFVPEGTTGETIYKNIEFNPLLNRILEKRELKRLAIHMLAKPYAIRTDYDHYIDALGTKISLTALLDTHASYIKFFEQCFDWEIMAYTFYPYYYGLKSKWIDLFQQSNGTDSIFQAFLQSGMARMVVPVRPGFENAVNYFLETGEIWIGDQIAIEDDEDLYLSIAEETQVVESVVEQEWETRVPTSLTIVQANSAPLDDNGLPCCTNENTTENLGHGNSIMMGKQDPPQA